MISADALKAMYTPQFPLPGQKAGYGLGVNSRPYHGATLLFHGGGGYGYSTDQRWVPEYKVGVVILSNGDGGDNFVADLADRTLTGDDPRQAGGLASGRATPLDAGAGHHAQARRLRRLEGKLPGRGSVDRVPPGRRPATRRPRKAHRAPGCTLAVAVQSRPQSLRVPVRRPGPSAGGPESRGQRRELPACPTTPRATRRGRPSRNGRASSASTTPGHTVRMTKRRSLSRTAICTGTTG